jgi:ABC-type sulfate transport system permease component
MDSFPQNSEHISPWTGRADDIAQAGGLDHADSAAHWSLAWTVACLAAFRGKVLVEAMLAFPLVLPPTVLGFYVLVVLGGASPIGQIYQRLFGHPLVFSFEGLLIASVLFNLPFAIQPMQRHSRRSRRRYGMPLPVAASRTGVPSGA